MKNLNHPRRIPGLNYNLSGIQITFVFECCLSDKNLFYKSNKTVTGDKSGNKYISLEVNHFSKYTATYAILGHDNKTVIDYLAKLFLEFGTPSKILSDQGR